MRRTLKKMLPAQLLSATRRARAQAAWLRFLTGGYAPRPRERTEFHAKRVLAVAPHIDDELIGAGGTLLRLRDAGARVSIAYAFSAEQRRRDEAETIRSRARWHDLRFANLPDTDRLPDTAALPAELLAGDWDEIYLPHPHDNHPGHLALPRLLAPLLAGLPRQTRLLLYEVWTPLIPSVIVDIGAVEAEKLALLHLCTSQLVDKDYCAATQGLARYRALWLPRRGGAAEVFLELDRNDYLALADLA